MVLGLLSVKKLAHAKSCLETFIKMSGVEKTKEVPFYDAISGLTSDVLMYKSQLLNFSILLMMAVERGAVCQPSYCR
jgi:hypothetical protein